jgi:4'-phosphopantetheinyl transferase
MNSYLSEQTIEICYILTGVAGEDAYARLFPRLTPLEQARALQFLLLKDRLAFSAGRLLIRKLLSQYGTEPPGGWSLVENAYGKPAIAPKSGSEDIRFNISHSTGVVVAALARERDIGVDVELVVYEEGDYLDLARTQFTATEFKLLEALHGRQRSEAFFSLWTLKESYAKARGIGLSLSMSDFAFSLDPPSISFASQGSEKPDHWFFWQDQLSTSHVLAIAAQRLPEEQLICCIRQMSLRELF